MDSCSARFGLMHMIATNLCVWLHVLIQETKHQIMIVVNPNMTHQLMPELANSWNHAEHVVEELSEDYFDTFEQDDISSSTPTPLTSTLHSISRRSIVDHESVTHGLCRRSNVIGQLVQDASQFLFPCTIEYSLICAAVLYMMWKHTGDMRFVSFTWMDWQEWQVNNNKNSMSRMSSQSCTSLGHLLPWLL